MRPKFSRRNRGQFLGLIDPIAQHQYESHVGVSQRITVMIIVCACMCGYSPLLFIVPEKHALRVEGSF